MLKKNETKLNKNNKYSNQIEYKTLTHLKKIKK